ncbi:MAG: L-2-amino-thiazoline-4-carboxylic acid hydrolase [Candidatus Thorarchaeota archaeon]
MKYIEENRPEVLNDYIFNLTKHYTFLSESSYPSSSTYVSNTEELKILGEHPQLVESCIDYVLSLLNLPAHFSWDSPEIESTLLKQRKASIIPAFQRIKQFAETTNARWTKEFLQSYSEYFVKMYRPVKTQQDLTKVFESDVEVTKTSKSTIGTYFLMDEGRYAFRTDKCIGHEVLSEFNEPELAYFTICAGDYEIVRKTNENFVLTRSNTLMDGPYCDGIVHDTRIVDKVEHMPDDFFRKLDDMKGN